MNWAEFEDPVSHVCLSGTMVASWSLIQEVAGLSPFTVMTNIFVTESAEFRETLRKNPLAVNFFQTCSEKESGSEKIIQIINEIY